MKNYFGKSPFERTLGEGELALKSRFFSFPDSKDSNPLKDKLIAVKPKPVLPEVKNKSRNPSLRVKESSDALQTLKSISLEKEAESDFIRQKVLKHRTLAGHLVRFSARKDVVLTTLPVKAVKVFLTLTVSQDAFTVTRGLMALSNICSDKFVRSVLIKDNALQTIASLAPSAEGE
jgi:hypothetical protein